MELGLGAIFLDERDGKVRGCIGGLAYSDPNTGRRVAIEHFWFVCRDHRGSGVRLYHEFEKWARQSGCQELKMGHLADSMPNELAKFYDRLGFEASEVVYVKELTPWV